MFVAATILDILNGFVLWCPFLVPSTVNTRRMFVGFSSDQQRGLNASFKTSTAKWLFFRLILLGRAVFRLGWVIPL